MRYLEPVTEDELRIEGGCGILLPVCIGLAVKFGGDMIYAFLNGIAAGVNDQ